MDEFKIRAGRERWKKIKNEMNNSRNLNEQVRRFEPL